MEIVRPDAPAESVALTIDEAGEAWVASGRPLAGAGIMVKLRYTLDEEPFEIEIPYLAGSR